MTCTETYSTIVIVSGEISPDEIESILEIKGAAKRAIEPDSKYRHRRENGVWRWCSRNVIVTTNNAAHIETVIDKFRSKSQALRQLRDSGCKTELWNYWHSTGQGGPSLRTKTMQELVNLGLDIVWDIYFDDQNEYT